MNPLEYLLQLDECSAYALEGRLVLRPHSARLTAWQPGTDRIEGRIETGDPAVQCAVSVRKTGRALRVLVSLEGGLDTQILDLRMSGVAGIARIGTSLEDAKTVLGRVAQRAARALDALESSAHRIAEARREPTPSEFADADEAGVLEALGDRVDYLRCAAGRLV